MRSPPTRWMSGSATPTWSTRRRLVWIHRLVDHVEAHLRGRAEKLTQSRRIFETGKLDENTVGADALDQRFGNADGIDALADDFQTLLDRLGRAVGKAGFGHCQGDGVTILGHVDIGRRAAEAERADGGSEFLQLRQNFFAVGRIFDLHGNGITGNTRRRGRNALGAERPARIVKQGFEASLAQAGSIDFENEVRAALEVEAEGHRLDRQPACKLFTLCRRQHVRKRRDTSEDDHDDIDENRPFRCTHVVVPEEPARARGASSGHCFIKGSCSRSCQPAKIRVMDQTRGGARIWGPWFAAPPRYAAVSRNTRPSDERGNSNWSDAGRSAGKPSSAADLASLRSAVNRRSESGVARESCLAVGRSLEPVSLTLPAWAPDDEREGMLCPTEMTCIAKEAQNSHSTARSRPACMFLLPPPMRSIEDAVPFPGGRTPARRKLSPNARPYLENMAGIEHGRL